jgi:hypothetical protein
MSIPHRSLIALLLAGSLLITGCASISKSACQSGDWYDIGLRDGNSGRTEDRFLDHAQSCAKHGLPADRGQWLAGRERGLEQYCTTVNGLAVGESNGHYGGVCPVAREPDFLRGYQVGNDLSRARARLSALDAEMHRIERRLAPPEKDKQDGDGPGSHELPLNDDERIRLAYELGVHSVERRQLLRELEQIEQVAHQL